MSSRISPRLLSRLLRSALYGGATSSSTTTIPKHHPSIPPHFNPTRPVFTVRAHSTLTRPTRTHRSARPDIAARARQLQTRRLWTYAITFSCIAGFIVIVLNQFQDQLVFYVTPTDALNQHSQNPSKSKFRLGGLVLENSLIQIPNSPEIEFVITDLITDILVKYDGSLPDLFREGHSVVVEGFIKPYMEEEKRVVSESKMRVTEKARGGECYFKATEVLAKHDEKYMPGEVAAAIEKNKKLISEREGNEDKDGVEAPARA